MVLHIGYILTIFLFGLVIYILVRDFEYIACVSRSQIPFVSSTRVLRAAVVNEINKNYAYAKSVCDIGGGYGGLARYVARKCDVQVISLENMPFSYGVARGLDFLSCADSKTLFVDAFKYLDNKQVRFDIGIAYLGPSVNHILAQYISRFDALITLDVPIDGLKPTRIIDVGHGYTTYGIRHKFPHKLFVYES